MVNKKQLTQQNYSTGDIANLLGVSSQTVINYTNKGVLVATRDKGNRRVISKENLVAFLEAQNLLEDTVATTIDEIVVTADTNKGLPFEQKIKLVNDTDADSGIPTVEPNTDTFFDDDLFKEVEVTIPVKEENFDAFADLFTETEIKVVNMTDSHIPTKEDNDDLFVVTEVPTCTVPKQVTTNVAFANSKEKEVVAHSTLETAHQDIVVDNINKLVATAVTAETSWEESFEDYTDDQHDSLLAAEFDKFADDRKLSETEVDALVDSATSKKTQVVVETDDFFDAFAIDDKGVELDNINPDAPLFVEEEIYTAPTNAEQLKSVVNTYFENNVTVEPTKYKGSTLKKLKDRLDAFGPTPIPEEDRLLAQEDLSKLKPSKKEISKAIEQNNAEVVSVTTETMLTPKTVKIKTPRKGLTFKTFLRKHSKALTNAFVLFAFTVGLTTYVLVSEEQANRTKTELIENSVVLKWVNLFCEKQYTNSDEYLAETQYRIYNSEFVGMVDEASFYETAIGKLSECIESVKVDNVVQGKYNNQSVYTLTVTIKPYVAINTLDENITTDEYATKLTELSNNFIANNISEYDYRKGLNKTALQIYEDTCFKPSDDTIVLTVVLAQQTNEEGNMVVYGVEDFISELMDKSNTYTNTSVYQNEISTYLSNNTVKSVVDAQNAEEIQLQPVEDAVAPTKEDTVTEAESETTETP